jgi:hypothetical protein
MPTKRRESHLSVPLWAKEIQVEVNGDTLVVSGQNHHTTPLEDLLPDFDLMEFSRGRIVVGQRHRQYRPHVEFANATTDDALIAFVRRWGPVAGTDVHAVAAGQVAVAGAETEKQAKREPIPRNSASVKVLNGGIEISHSINGREETVFYHVRQYSLTDNIEWNVSVHQSLTALRAEHRIFAATARLIAELQNRKRNLEKLFGYCAVMAECIPLKLERDSFFELACQYHGGERQPQATCAWAAHYLCQVLNRFPNCVYAGNNGPVELPPLDSQSIARGVKHVLYFFLRQEYLLPRGRLGLGVCQYSKCEKVFAKERRGASFCDEECSRRARGLEYYYEKGRERRQEKSNA